MIRSLKVSDLYLLPYPNCYSKKFVEDSQNRRRIDAEEIIHRGI